MKRSVDQKEHKPNPARSTEDKPPHAHLTMIDALPREGLGRENFIPSSGSRHHHVFLNMAQTLKRPKKIATKMEPSSSLS
jgi:hypothetical protein